MHLGVWARQEMAVLCGEQGNIDRYIGIPYSVKSRKKKKTGKGKGKKEKLTCHWLRVAGVSFL